MFTPSKYQSAIFNWHDVATANKQAHALVVQAVAGSGKTTTGVVALQDHVPDNLNAAAIAFNKSIADTLVEKLQGRTVKTYHAFGLANLTAAFGQIKVDANKVDLILKDRLVYWERQLISPVKKLVSLCKNNLIEPTDENLSSLCIYYGIETNGDVDKVFSLAQQAYKESLAITQVIDFDDMISMPLLLHVPMKSYDYLFVDELQDTNPAQAELVAKSLSSNGIIVGYGDVRQSIYAFRGADTEAMPKFCQRFNADQLPLSITYRNPLEVVKLVNTSFPDIQFEAFEKAIQGEVKSDSFNKVDFIPDDMVLCRTNAPLVKPCFELIRKGIKAIIRGRDIGQNLISMINKFKINDLNELLRRLVLYRDSELMKLISSNKTTQAQLLDDKVETVLALSEGCITIDDLKNRITTVFSDDVAAITFSSIHKAKGLEARRVFILKPELLPHPMAKTPWEIQQEQNLKYVAFTRALETLVFVEGA